MNTQHPFTWLSASAQKWAFLITLILTLAVLAALQVLGRPLNTAAAPASIVSFELAGDLATAREILDSWGPFGQVYAGLNLGLDYLFLLLYPTAIGLGCVLVAGELTNRLTGLAKAGVLLAWVLYLAATLDAVENFAMIKVLLGSGNPIWPPVARWCALPKFAIVILGLLYVLVGVLLILVVKTVQLVRDQ